MGLQEVLELSMRTPFHMYFLCLAPGTGYLVPGTWYLVPGTWCLVPGAWCLVAGTCYLAPGTWILPPGTACLVPVRLRFPIGLSDCTAVREPVPAQAGGGRQIAALIRCIVPGTLI